MSKCARNDFETFHFDRHRTEAATNFEKWNNDGRIENMVVTQNSDVRAAKRLLYMDRSSLTSKPTNSKSREMLSPIIVERRWPTCISFAIFGDEKSTITRRHSIFGTLIPCNDTTLDTHRPLLLNSFQQKPLHNEYFKIANIIWFLLLLRDDRYWKIFVFKLLAEYGTVPRLRKKWSKKKNEHMWIQAKFSELM